MKKIILITGSNKGIGFQMAKQLGEKGNIIIMTARNTDFGSKAYDQLKKEGIDVYFFPLDVTDQNSISNAYEYVEKEFGKLDILINNAGIFLDTHKKVSEITYEEFRKTLDVNLLGVFSVTNAFIPLLKKSSSARIINMSSDLGSISQASNPNSKFYPVWGPSYRASKVALNMLSLSYARELKDSNISVNVVSPGWCKTDLGTEAAPKTAAEGADSPVWVATQNEKALNSSFISQREIIDW